MRPSSCSYLCTIRREHSSVSRCRRRPSSQTDPPRMRSGSAICNHLSKHRHHLDGGIFAHGICPPVAWQQHRPVRRSTPLRSQGTNSVGPRAINPRNWAGSSIRSFSARIHNTSRQVGLLQRPTEPHSSASASKLDCIGTTRLRYPAQGSGARSCTTQPKSLRRHR